MPELLATPLFNDANLISYWDFNASNSNDNKGSNNGTDTNVTYSTANGKFGVGAGFDGTTSQIVIGTASNTNITGALTAHIWAKQNGTVAVGRVLFGKGNQSSAANYSWNLVLLTGGNIRFQVSGGTNETVVDTVGSITDNLYHQLDAVYIPSTSITVYIDGTPAGTTTTSIPSSLNSLPSGTLTIGNDTGDVTGRWYPGEVDDVALFNRALSASEISNLYKSGGFMTTHSKFWGAA